MRLIATCKFLHGVCNIEAGQTLELSDSEGAALIARGYADPVKEKQSKKTNAKNTEEG